MPIYFVEQLAPTAALPDLRDDLTRLLTAVRRSSANATVRWVSAAYVPSREACLSLVEAVDLSSVRGLLDAVNVRGAVEPAVVLHRPDLQDRV